MPRAEIVSAVPPSMPLPSAGGGHATFVELSGDWLTADRWLWGLERQHDELAQLVDERAARELLARYAYSFDARDWEWLSSLFADDSSLVTASETVHGKHAVVAAFENRQKGTVQSTLRYANPVLRRAEAGDAWLSASFHLSTMDADQHRASTFGRVFGRLSRHGSTWRIADWRIFASEVLPLKSASDRSRVLTMPDISPERDRFDLAVNRGAWSARKWLIDMPVPDDSGEVALHRLAREQQVREMLIAYFAALDSKDADRVMWFFRDDAVVTASAGRFRYTDRIKMYVDAHLQNRAPSFHRLMNTAVRLSSDGSEAWFSTYFYAVRPSQRRASDGHLLGRAVQEGGWRFVDLVVSTDGRRTFPASRGNSS
jgi:ketosteroid isomerase-like protein